MGLTNGPTRFAESGSRSSGSKIRIKTNTVGKRRTGARAASLRVLSRALTSREAARKGSDWWSFGFELLAGTGRPGKCGKEGERRLLQVSPFAPFEETYIIGTNLNFGGKVTKEEAKEGG